jgi:hypothetical protein
MFTLRQFVFLLICFIAFNGLRAEDAPQDATASPWPLDIPSASGVITLYQPQPEKLVGNTLTGRAAASFLATGKTEDERIFGAFWYTATLDIDRKNDIAKARSMTITKVVTPQGEKTADDGIATKKMIQDTVIALQLEMDLDRLIATLEEVNSLDDTTFNLTPPRIFIRQEPTILVVLDGEAKTREVDGVKRVVNSPAFLIDVDGTWWLRGDRDWLTAISLRGPWGLSPVSVPRVVNEAAQKAGYPTSLARLSNAKAPAVLVVTEATELVVFTGKPSFTPIGAGELLGANNSDTTTIVEVATGTHFLLLAGRWYCADKLTDNATWKLVKPTELPESFKSIPVNGDYGDVRAHVAGTLEADEATAQQQIPQTARIPRTTTITVTFDGEPKWIKVSKMEVEYAENSADAVFRIPGELFYVCRDGVWYEGNDPRGTFTVATSVPEALRRLPAECPWHNVTYVQVYESTSEYVWYGYTPGYMGYYSWYGCPIYGTGWSYHGWYGPIAYPRPLTWGVGIHYNPWNGWGVHVGSGGPHWSIGVSTGGGHYGGGWYGCGGGNTINIDNSKNINTGNINTGNVNTGNVNTGNINTGNINTGNVNTGNVNTSNINTGNINTSNINTSNINTSNINSSTKQGIYDRVPGAEQPTFQDASNRMRNQSINHAGAPPATRDNLAVDRDGNIARSKADGSWQTREAGGWKDQPAAQSTQQLAQQPVAKPVARPVQQPATKPVQQPATKPVTKPVQQPATKPAPSYEQTKQQRDRGEQRVQQRSAPQTSNSSGSGSGSGSSRGGEGGRSR